MDDCSVGIAERQEKLALTICGIILQAYFPTLWVNFLTLFPPSVLDFFLSIQMTNILTLFIAIAGILSHLTVVQRLAYARKIINARENEV
jgi:hypothetical protein